MTSTDDLFVTGPYLDSNVRIRGFGFCLPGDRVPLARFAQSDRDRRHLENLGQEFTFTSDMNSTELSIRAAQDALDVSGVKADNISCIITAPSLLPSYGMEIPAIALRAELGLNKAQCINLGQGCVGILRGIQLGAQQIAMNPGGGDVLVVASCRASTITTNQTHGAFYWGDAAGAVILTADPGPGAMFAGFTEASSDADWGAMRCGFGDGDPDSERSEISKITVNFESAGDQVSYIDGETLRFNAVLDALIQQYGLREDDLAALILPSFGKNRLPQLFKARSELNQIVETDFRYGHLGGVDTILFLKQYLESNPPADGAWLALMTAAYTAQWGGALFKLSA